MSVENVLEFNEFETYMRDVAGICDIQFKTVGNGYEIHQRSYIEDILERCQERILLERQPTPINICDRMKVITASADNVLKLYQKLPGSYNWLVGIIRPNSAFCASKFESDTSTATETDLRQFKRVLG